MSIGRTLGLVLTLVVGWTACNPALARDQWSINHGANNPPVDPRLMPGGSLSGMVPSFNGDFWKGQLANTIPAGTVLTAILEDDLSSAKNHAGDTFALSIDDGFSMNGKMLIPPKSRIIGTVTAASPARMQRNGHPGDLEISMQTLVLPDGSHYPFSGFIDGNPNSKSKAPAKKRHMGVAISDYGDSLKGMAMSVVSGPGFMMKKLQRGLDFSVDAGDALPIRLTRGIEMNQSPLSAQQPMGMGMGIRQNAVPGLVDPNGPVQLPGFVPMNSNGAPNTVPTYGGNQMPPMAPPATTYSDPNQIFNQPLQQQRQMQNNGLSGLPDPF